jgi:hypothetical protein
MKSMFVARCKCENFNPVKSSDVIAIAPKIETPLPPPGRSRGTIYAHVTWRIKRGGGRIWATVAAK